jgi:adenosylcobinamide-GDP ribazoletransferase
MGFIIALKFLTIIPVQINKKVDTADLLRSLPYFPLVGLMLGGILYGLYRGLIFILPSMVIFVLLIITEVILTGANHVDGLMDTFDGLVIGKTREERLAIMSDSKVGSFGITAAILIFLLKYVSLTSTAMILPALTLMPTLSRWMMTGVIFMSPAAKDTGMGATFKGGATWGKFAVSTIIALAAAVVLLNWRGLVLIAALWIIGTLIALYFRSFFGGLTGDNYGAINEISEVVVLILIIITTHFIGGGPVWM